MCDGQGWFRLNVLPSPPLSSGWSAVSAGQRRGGHISSCPFWSVLWRSAKASPPRYGAAQRSRRWGHSQYSINKYANTKTNRTVNAKVAPCRRPRALKSFKPTCMWSFMDRPKGLQTSFILRWSWPSWIHSFAQTFNHILFQISILGTMLLPRVLVQSPWTFCFRGLAMSRATYFNTLHYCAPEFTLIHTQCLGVWNMVAKKVLVSSGTYLGGTSDPPSLFFYQLKWKRKDMARLSGLYSSYTPRGV